MAHKDDKLIYPPGVRDITEDISTDDLVRRLKDCAQAFQSMSQEDDNSRYIPLALHLASETFLEHPSRDIRLLVACCIADVFRVYAPDAPYKDMNQLKVIFEFFVDQLRGLEDPSKPSFKRYFYLLENFSCVKTFNICVEIEDNQKILIHLFKLMFRIINENHSVKVKKFMLDMLSPLISEADVVSQELLDVILSQIIEPVKSQNRNSCSLAQDILKRNISSLEPYIQAFFNNALILGKTLQSDVARHLYELIYELNRICPSMLVVVLPQLEFKLKSNEEKERLDVTRVLARMFSDQNSTMIEENKTLWSCFLARFNDISPQVRIRCVQYSKQFLLNHPEAKDDITEQLKQRHRDVDENVRYEVVLAILSTAKENFSAINEELLSFVKERTLDKKFKIRKEALLGLAMLYKQHVRGSELTPTDIDSISWIKNKVLHAYYQTSLEDRLLVERILHTCIVPYQKPIEERMKLLYHLFCSVDDYAVKAFKEIMKCQSVLRTQMRSILDVIQCEKNDNRQKTVATKVSLLSKNLQDPSKSNEYILKFCSDLESNLKLRSMMAQILNGNISCAEAEAKVKDVLKSLGHPVQTNTYYMIIKQLLERIAPVMVDKDGIRHLVECAKDALLGECVIESELGLTNSSHRGLELLWVLTFVFPTAFHDEYIYNNLLLFLHVEDEVSADMTLQIFMNISNEMEMYYPDFSGKLLLILENFVETGTAKQAKHAVYCINSIVCDKEKVFGNIIENLKKHFTLKSQYFRSALVSVGHIAYLCHDMFAADLKNIVSKIVVRDLLMLDQDLPRGGDETWGPLDSLPDETKVKIEGMKVMVRWLAGLKDMVQPAMSTMRLLTTVILHDGDLMERQHTAPIENSWMRLSAATCMLKLCQEPNYANVITLDQFQVLAYVLNDKCPEVKDRFAQKVHKGLFTLKLPLEFLAMFALGALDERKEFRAQVKNYLIVNINKRKEYVKQRVLSNDKLRAFLPDYALPYAVHLLAHAPVLKTYNDVSALIKVKECLWLLMEPLMIKNENYSFSFFKRLLENIKQTKDKQAPDDTNMNMKLYAVCDLALSIVMSKTTNFVLKDFPVEPALPSKLFTDTDLSYSNLKTYLPPELICDKPLKSGFEIDLFESAKDTPAAPQNETSVMNDISVNISNVEHDVSNNSNSRIDESAVEVVSEAVLVKTRSRTKKGDLEKDLETLESPSSEEVSEISDCASDEQSTEAVLRTSKMRSTAKAKTSASVKNKQNTLEEKLANTKEKVSDTKEKICNVNEKVNTRRKVTEIKEKLNAKDKIKGIEKLNQKEKISEIKEKQNEREKLSIAKDKFVKKPEVSQRSIRSSRSSVSTSLKSSDSSEYSSSGRQNGVLPSDMNSSSLSPEVQSSIKECNVSLTKGEVERYIALSNSIMDSNDENSMSDNDFHNNSTSQNTLETRDSPVTLRKRKRDDSPASRSVRSRGSSKSSDKQVNNSSPPSKDKTVLKSKTNLSQSQSFPKNNTVKKDTKMSLVNGNRGSRITSKGSTPQKTSPKLPPKRNQRNLIRANLRKR